jgi:hypothetical protein
MDGVLVHNAREGEEADVASLMLVAPQRDLPRPGQVGGLSSDRRTALCVLYRPTLMTAGTEVHSSGSYQPQGRANPSHTGGVMSTTEHHDG